MNYYLVHYTEQPSLQFPSEFTKVVQADNPKDAVAGIEDSYVIQSVKMIVNPETSYTVLKNHLHNTLELTKSDIRKMVEEAIEDIVERRLDVFLEYNDGIQRVIDAAIREKSSSAWLWGNDKNLDKVIQDKIVARVTDHLIKGIGLNVSLKKKKNDKSDDV